MMREAARCFVLFAGLVASLFAGLPVAAAGPGREAWAGPPAGARSETPVGMPLRMVMDVRSTHSDGKHDFETLIALARQRRVDVLAFGEHDRFDIRLGLSPVPQWLGWTMSHPSLYRTGLKAFFDDLARARRAHPEMTLMAGTESIPGYRWSGIPFHNLTLHDAERHIIALGLERPAQVEALPSYRLTNIRGPFRFSIAFWLLLTGGVLVMLLRRRKRGVALLLTASLVAFLASWLIRPRADADAAFIRAAHEQGLFVAWAHPGTHSGVRPGPMGVRLETPPYNARVFHPAKPAEMADAFAAIYGDSDDNCEPGGRWDRFMMNFMAGVYPKPVWAVAAGDFHGQGEAGEYLGNHAMDVWTANGARTPAAVLEALRKGRMAAWRLPKDRNLRLAALWLEDGRGHRGLPGASLLAGGQVRLHAALAERPAGGPGPRRFRAEIVVDGRVAARPALSLDAPLDMSLQLPPGAHVIRLRIPMQHAIRMEANPFLVRVPG